MLVIISPVLIIDCAELQRADSDTRLVGALSKQTGYWPVFTFLTSMNNLVDLASVGLIGQKGMVSRNMTYARIDFHNLNSRSEFFPARPG